MLAVQASGHNTWLFNVNPGARTQFLMFARQEPYPLSYLSLPEYLFPSEHCQLTIGFLGT